MFRNFAAALVATTAVVSAAQKSDYEYEKIGQKLVDKDSDGWTDSQNLEFVQKMT